MRALRFPNREAAHQTLRERYIAMTSTTDILFSTP